MNRESHRRHVVVDRCVGVRGSWSQPLENFVLLGAAENETPKRTGRGRGARRSSKVRSGHRGSEFKACSLAEEGRRRQRESKPVVCFLS